MKENVIHFAETAPASFQVATADINSAQSANRAIKDFCFDEVSNPLQP
jgi:hypothetical protein